MTTRTKAQASSRRACLRALSLAPLAAALAACGGGGDAPVSGGTVVDGNLVTRPADTRAWRMGFGGTPPRLDVATAVQNIDLWSQRAEMAAIFEEVPWTDLLAGAEPQALLERNHVGLVNYYRAKGLKVMFVAELNDGLAREADAPQLRALGRSLTEPAVQQAWRRYVVAVARVLQPDWICLAAETNLVRLAAPAALYNAVRQCANDGAIDLRKAGLARMPVLVSSVQVETAWGQMPGQDGVFKGIAKDLEDFAFCDCLGLSSYPYLAKSKPEDLPDDWYSRVVAGANRSVMVTESGWSSANVIGLSSSPELQRRYMLRHAALLDGIGAVGMVQLVFADIDLASLAQPLPANLPVFAHLGLSDSDFNAKPALAAWDTLQARRLI